MNVKTFESLLNDYSADHVMVGFCCAARNMDLARYYADKRDASKKRLLAAFRESSQAHAVIRARSST